MRKNLASRAFGPVPLLLLLGSSCSLVYDLSPDQCGSNADCINFGDGFTCDAGVCTCRDASCTQVSGGSGGKGGTGGTSGTGGTGGDAGMIGETGGTSATAGMSGAGGSSKGGAGGSGGGGSGEGGSAGMEEGPECATHKDCSVKYSEDWETNPRACVEQACVPLMTPDCPFVLPGFDNGDWELLTSTDAIIIGGYAPFSGPALGTFGRNYDLALTELSRGTKGGVYVGGTQKREIVMVVCNSLYPSRDALLTPSRHLMESLKVPAVVSALLLQDQQYVWENVARDTGAFMMMPTYSDQALIDEPDNGLIWHMLSGADKLSVSYQPLLDMTVGHLRALGSLGETETLKVAHLKAQDEPFLQDTAAYLEENLQFNGQSVNANIDSGNYQPISILSDYADPEDEDETNANAIASILTFAPHVVIGTTVSELYERIIPGVEIAWDEQNPGRARPFYLVGALGYVDAAMAGMINADTTNTLYRRILGVNWPAAVDQSVYDDYQNRWLSAYGAKEHGYENFYDAAYYLLYGIAAARAPLTGLQISKGLIRIVASGSNVAQVEVGPGEEMESWVGRLSSDSRAKIELIGAMGPPNWDEFGARNDPGSIWCVNPVGSYQPDKFRYDPESATLQPSGTPIEEVCFPFPASPPLE